MSAQLNRVFAELASKVRVPDGDLQVLSFLGVVNADEMSYRFPNSSALEDFLAVVFDHRVDDNGVVVPQPAAPADLRVWLRGPEAAAIRRLHEASRALAQRELAKLVDEPLPGEGPRKLTPSVLFDLEEKALAAGMPSLDDESRPGQQCLAKVNENFRLGGELRFIPWQDYTSVELESCARRQGITGKEIGLKLIPSAAGLRGVAVSEDFRRLEPTDLLAVSEVFQIRAAAHAILQIVPFDTYHRFGRELLRMLRRSPPDSMRSPTIKEAELADRLMHEQVLPFVARGDGTLSNGLLHYLGEGRSHNFWNLLEPQPSSIPDRGAEKSLKRSRDSSLPAASSGPMLCFVCGQPRDAHPGRRFCISKKDKGAGKSAFRSKELAAGRQLRWQKSAQLIEDGLHDEWEHVRRATLLQPPYLLSEPLAGDLQSTIAFVAEDPCRLQQARESALAELQQVCASLKQPSELYAAQHAGRAYRHMQLSYNVLAMKWLQTRVDVADPA
eukprot:6489178-Amphidinium_carterae.1